MAISNSTYHTFSGVYPGVGVGNRTSTSTSTNNTFISNHSALPSVADLKSITSRLESIEKMLCILLPVDERKLQKFESLKTAYDNYKLIETLIHDE